MNRVLDEILLSGSTLLPTGEQVKITSSIDQQCGLLLQRAIRELRPAVCVEVGLAFGISTLYMLEVIAETGGRLIGMDPAQHDDNWRGGGLHNISRAGFESYFEFHEDTSQNVLPSLVKNGHRIQLAFIDGWHTFDHTLVDFFYIDQMLDKGGIVVFDDVGYPSIKRACDFIITNRDYEVYACVRQQDSNNLRRRIKHQLRRILSTLVRTDRTPSFEAQAKEYGIHNVYFLALRKVSDDRRRWDHFVHF